MRLPTAIAAFVLALIPMLAGAGEKNEPLPEALWAMRSAGAVHVDERWNLIRFLPSRADRRESTCFAFYPGALINPQAYAPYARALAEKGYIAYILKLPGRIALLAPDAADAAKRDWYAKQDCRSFVIGGHSLGGVAAVNYVQKHPENGLVLLASYPESTTDISAQTQTVVSSIYGSNDCETTIADIDASRARLPPETHYLEIVGANHQQFGWYYDSVKADCRASISRNAQSSSFIDETLRVLGQYAVRGS